MLEFLALVAALHDLTVLQLEHQKNMHKMLEMQGFWPAACRVDAGTAYSFQSLPPYGPAVESLLQNPQKKNCSAEKRFALMLSGRNITLQVDSSKRLLLSDLSAASHQTQLR